MALRFLYPVLKTRFSGIFYFYFFFLGGGAISLMGLKIFAQKTTQPNISFTLKKMGVGIMPKLGLSTQFKMIY